MRGRDYGKARSAGPLAGNMRHGSKHTGGAIYSRMLQTITHRPRPGQRCNHERLASEDGANDTPATMCSEFDLLKLKHLLFPQLLQASRHVPEDVEIPLFRA